MSSGVIKAKIFRFDPDKDKEPYFQNYEIPIERQVTVHEFLNIIHEITTAHLHSEPSSVIRGCALPAF